MCHNQKNAISKVVTVEEDFFCCSPTRFEVCVRVCTAVQPSVKTVLTHKRAEE